MRITINTEKSILCEREILSCNMLWSCRIDAARDMALLPPGAGATHLLRISGVVYIQIWRAVIDSFISLGWIYAV